VVATQEDIRLFLDKAFALQERSLSFSGEDSTPMLRKAVPGFDLVEVIDDVTVLVSRASTSIFGSVLWFEFQAEIRKANMLAHAFQKEAGGALDIIYSVLVYTEKTPAIIEKCLMAAGGTPDGSVKSYVIGMRTMGLDIFDLIATAVAIEKEIGPPQEDSWEGRLHLVIPYKMNEA